MFAVSYGFSQFCRIIIYSLSLLNRQAPFVFCGILEPYSNISGQVMVPNSRLRTIPKWLNHLGVKALFIARGSSWENGYLESFSGKLRDELLNRETFITLAKAKVLIEQ